MQLTPRYEGPDVVRLEVLLGDPSIPFLRQRRRLGQTLTGLSDAEWSSPSRCEAWTVQDVVAHLVGTNQFWTMSISGGMAGAPTRFLETFDPVTTPAALVEGSRRMPPAEVLARYVHTVEELAAVVTGLSDDAWSARAEAPPGHVQLRGVLLHGLWDGWTHERDIVLPLGRQPTTESDEVRACLMWAAAIGPTLLATRGSTRRGLLAVEATDPYTDFIVEAGPTVTVRERTGHDVVDASLRGDAVELVEGLTFRGPLDHDLPGEHAWLLGGLDETFDVAR